MLLRLSNLIRKAFPAFSSDTGPYRGEFAGDPAPFTVSPESALTVAAVCASVRLLSETIASIPVHIYRDLGKSKSIEMDHPMYNLVHWAPNEFQTAHSFFQLMVVHVLLHGNFFALVDRDDRGNPIALWPLRPQGVTVLVTDSGIVYRYYDGARKEVFSFDQVLHIKGPSLDGLNGISVIHMAREGIALASAQDRHGTNLFRNNARPGMVLKHPGVLSNEAHDRLKESVQSSYSGTNQYKSMVIEEGMDIASYGFSSEDAQYLESRQFSVVEIARWFRVPPTMIGDMSRVSYSSSESEMQMFATHSIVPFCSNIEAEMNLKLFPTRTQFFAKFDVNSIVRGDLAARYAAYSQGLTAGFLTVADVRSAEGLAFIQGTDQLNTPANMVPQGGTDDGTNIPAA